MNYADGTTDGHFLKNCERLIGLHSMLFDHTKPTRIRIMAFLGLLTSLSMVWLGVWPSLFTLVAIIVLPAAFLFVGVFFWPRLIAIGGIRVYLIASAGISIVGLLFQFIWLASNGHGWIPPWRY